MKRILLSIVILHFIALFISCEKDIMNYEGQEGVYFAVRHGTNLRPENWPYQSSSNVNFFRLNMSEVELSIPVAITGPIKDYDRTFEVEVNSDSTTAVLGEHYQAIDRSWIIPAGAISTNIKVRLNKTPDMEDTTKTLGLRLIATKDFTLSFPEWDAIPSLNGGPAVQKFDASLHTLKLSDIMVEPAEWLGNVVGGNRESGMLGVFTRRKMEFLEEHLGLTYEDFASPESMPLARILLTAMDATDILVRLFNEKTPVLEDDGRLMWIGNVPWTSYLGVPYVPGN